MRRLPIALALVAAVSCSKPPREPLQLDGNRLIVENATNEPWTDVQLWLNSYYRLTKPTIQPGETVHTSLDLFVAGFGQRFEFRRMQVRDLRLTAKLPDGRSIEIKKDFVVGGLAVLKGRS